MESDAVSGLMPTDPFDVQLRGLSGHPNGASTQPSSIQSTDEYGHTTHFTVQTVKWAKGNTVFITQVSSRGSARIILPPEVTRTVARQAESVITMVRRNHGKRLADEAKAEGRTPTFTPEMRAKALKTRTANAAKRRARKKK